MNHKNFSEFWRWDFFLSFFELVIIHLQLLDSLSNSLPWPCRILARGYQGPFGPERRISLAKCRFKLVRGSIHGAEAGAGGVKGHDRTWCQRLRWNDSAWKTIGLKNPKSSDRNPLPDQMTESASRVDYKREGEFMKLLIIMTAVNRISEVIVTRNSMCTYWISSLQIFLHWQHLSSVNFKILSIKRNRQQ